MKIRAPRLSALEKKLLHALQMLLVNQMQEVAYKKPVRRYWKKAKKEQ